jgi:hypothetical protein
LGFIFICDFQQSPQPPEPFASFAINVFFQDGSIDGVVGPAARHFVCFECFVVKNLCIPCILWFLFKDNIGFLNLPAEA